MRKRWKLLHRMLALQSPWVTVYADRIEDDTGKELDYWHVDRADSVVIIVLYKNQFVLPEPVYRVGADEVMLDFAGGRIAEGHTPAQAATAVLHKELGIRSSEVASLHALLDRPLVVDSSFSSQRLHGMVAEIRDVAELPHWVSYRPLGAAGELHRELRCLQCRALLAEYLLQRKN